MLRLRRLYQLRHDFVYLNVPSLGRPFRLLGIEFSFHEFACLTGVGLTDFLVVARDLILTIRRHLARRKVLGPSIVLKKKREFLCSVDYVLAPFLDDLISVEESMP